MEGLGRARIDEVQSVVAAMHGMARCDLKVRRRTREISYPRFEAMFLAREMTGHSYPSIARMFGGFDHTSILYGVRKIKAQMEWDEKLAARLNQARESIAKLVAERTKHLRGSSSEWTPLPPVLKPTSIEANYDQASWLRLGGELEIAA